MALPKSSLSVLLIVTFCLCQLVQSEKNLGRVGYGSAPRKINYGRTPYTKPTSSTEFGSVRLIKTTPKTELNLREEENNSPPKGQVEKEDPWYTTLALILLAFVIFIEIGLLLVLSYLFWKRRQRRLKALAKFEASKRSQSAQSIEEGFGGFLESPSTSTRRTRVDAPVHKPVLKQHLQQNRQFDEFRHSTNRRIHSGHKSLHTQRRSRCLCGTHSAEKVHRTVMQVPIEVHSPHHAQVNNARLQSVEDENASACPVYAEPYNGSERCLEVNPDSALHSISPQGNERTFYTQRRNHDKCRHPAENYTTERRPRRHHQRSHFV